MLPAQEEAAQRALLEKMNALQAAEEAKAKTAQKDRANALSGEAAAFVPGGGAPEPEPEPAEEEWGGGLQGKEANPLRVTIEA